MGAAFSTRRCYAYDGFTRCPNRALPNKSFCVVHQCLLKGCENYKTSGRVGYCPLHLAEALEKKRGTDGAA